MAFASGLGIRGMLLLEVDPARGREVAEIASALLRNCTTVS